MSYDIINKNCLDVFSAGEIRRHVDLTFLDPPFNQNKEYAFHQDNMIDESYWEMMQTVCRSVFEITATGGTIYFMQREKNIEFVLQSLRKTGWTLQNVIIWKKKTSAVPVTTKFGKHYQIIAYATKGERAKTFHRLRIDPELPLEYKLPRENGVFITDVWDDIRELTSGYFAGNEAIRLSTGERFHKQQTPIALLLRIILSSTNVGDFIFDPFAGTGTSLIVAHQLQRDSLGIEIDPQNVACIRDRLAVIHESDSIQKYYSDYKYSENISSIWANDSGNLVPKAQKVLGLFEN
ncbi:MAG: modification methylase [Candidatus Marinimicrobia bacterium CG08_land_8_20_14_0_20_45_22]|nr:MAG: modification methylase [Candidatus Marinimicrobia bacterium CG08_land_8_20_14_0_20_45_22]